MFQALVSGCLVNDNDVLINQSVELHHGDEIEMNEVVAFRFVLPSSRFDCTIASLHEFLF